MSGNNVSSDLKGRVCAQTSVYIVNVSQHSLDAACRVSVELEWK